MGLIYQSCATGATAVAEEILQVALAKWLGTGTDVARVVFMATACSKSKEDCCSDLKSSDNSRY